MNDNEIYLLLVQKVPSNAVHYCFDLWAKYRFTLKIRKNRVSKAGDFTATSVTDPRITLNAELNPYAFLITYVHEVAHLEVYLNYKSRLDPHGNAWKKTFIRLLQPMLSDLIFPEEILTALRKHMINPMASTYSDAPLTKILSRYDENKITQPSLSDLPDGSIFKLGKKMFVKGSLRRTRYLCKEYKSKREYLVPAELPVILVSPGVFGSIG
jgi:SprT protein